MTPRFRPASSVSEYIGVSGLSDAADIDGMRRGHPTSDDGTVAADTLFTDLKTGDCWYYDGQGWYAVTSKEDLIVAELRRVGKTLTEQLEVQNRILEEMRDLLLKIA